MSIQSNFKKFATLHSATCFLNSLLREWNGYNLCSSELGKHFEISLGNKSILIPIKKYSILGRHQYIGYFYLKNDDAICEITFETMVETLLDFLSNHFNTQPEQIEIFKNRVFASLKNIQLALENRSEQIREFGQCDFRFKESEQALMIGHNFHPNPKSRDEFNHQDALKFSPEFGGGFRLDWFMIDPSILYQKSAASFNEHKWTEELLTKDFTHNPMTKELLAQGMIPVPMHPWQLGILTKNPIIAHYIKDGRMVHIGTSNADWSATSSLRSVYRDQAPYMLKFSISLKLTNSVRNLLAREVARGLQLCDVLETTQGKKFLVENPQFKVINEPAYLCLKDAEGNPMDETIVLCRENPFNGKAAHGKVLLVALVQDAPLGGDNPIQKLVKDFVNGDSIYSRSKQWFSAYLNVAVKPLILAQANYGFTLGAHPQNLILDICHGLPVGAYFRDCQSVLFSEFGYALFASDVPLMSRENGNILNEKILSWFFSYHLILNSTFNVITALSADNHISEEELLDDLRQFFDGIRTNGVQDAFCLNYLLDEENLMHKGNFLCSFKSINETTTKDPFALYTPIQNSIVTHHGKLFYAA